MDRRRRWDWLERATGRDTARGIAEELGVTHPTILRWVKTHPPIATVYELCLRYNLDPVEAVVVWGFLPEEMLPHLNYAAIVQYAPVEVLAAEMAFRAQGYAKVRPDTLRRRRADGAPRLAAM